MDPVGLLLLLLLTIHSNRAQQESNNVTSVSTISTKPLNRTEQQHSHTKTVDTTKNTRRQLNNDDDLWSMVASMNDGTLRQDYDHEHSGTTSRKRRFKYDWNLNLDKQGRYRLNWRVNYPANYITFNLELELSEKSSFRFGSDLFALGFSRDGQFDSSDFCLIWFDLSHKIHLQDLRTNANNTLELIDESESVCKLLKSFVVKGRGGGNHSSDNNEHHQQQRQNSLQDQDDETEDDEEDAADAKPTAANKVDRVEIIFRRQLDVCEPRFDVNYYRIDNGTTNLIWFALRGPVLSIDGLNLNQLGSKAKEGGGGGAGHKHNQVLLERRDDLEFGLNRVQLIATKSKAEKVKHIDDEDDEQQTEAAHPLDIVMDNYRVPSKDTTYWCKLFKLPEKFESKRYHITRYESVIKPGNEHVVHHMELFNCATKNTRDLASLYSNGGWSGECSGADRPKATESCKRVILAWAMGARPLIYPQQVGQSIGGPEYNPYVVLEVHYNNVEEASGLVDSSGLRFHYTPKLRLYDAGVLEVGLEYTDKNSIPPRMITPLAGHCVSECTRVAIGSGSGGSTAATEHEAVTGMPHRHHARHHRQQQKQLPHENKPHHNHDEQPSGGIYIFAAQMHTHLTGVASWTEQVRGGRLVRELQRDDHYSPHFQEIRLLPEPVRVEPGDSLVHYCLYDTTKRANITLGGFATSDEMCVTYLHYYPKIDLEVCKSSVETRALEQYFAYLSSEEVQRSASLSVGAGGPTKASANKSISEKYKSIDWSPRRSRELIEFYSAAPLSVQCLKSNGLAWPGPWNGIEPTKIWPDYGGDDAHSLPDWPPYSRWPTLGSGAAKKLIEYRGQAGRRHEHCLRSAQGAHQRPVSRS